MAIHTAIGADLDAIAERHHLLRGQPVVIFGDIDVKQE
jgi:hypothetical protein